MSELEQLIANSKANEAISKKLFEIETEVLTSNSSDELLQRLLNSIKTKFNLTNIRLLLVDPTPISFLINENIKSYWYQQNTTSVTHKQLKKYHLNNKPYLTDNIQELLVNFSQETLGTGQSFALTPLILENKLFGSLLFTDIDKTRFTPNLGTFHLEQLAVKVSLCLSNVLAREQLEYIANYDRLTGLANRRLMEASITEELIRQRRYGVSFAVLFIDCNKFKKINDTYGHDCGDQVLVYVAQTLKQLIRENDRCFRYAGDEFVVTLASQNYKEALMAAKRLCQYFIDNPMPYEDKKLPITITCGAAVSDGELNMNELLKKADQQLYMNKKMTEFETE
ncbi:sensor domain-containing diguanylate cyclase [Pseudocolwellia agarivorans]|uniref:sensor domain-containing diguanylate cyclase n=1 Tax=Pseudocolwellia agarivorans TaxID=1911682 RepID=UPI000984EDD9|nr:sensor domain-containing diguanylate cyclase [Pseudocolwellia agarivorans]